MKFVNDLIVSLGEADRTLESAIELSLSDPAEASSLLPTTQSQNMVVDLVATSSISNGRQVGETVSTVRSFHEEVIRSQAGLSNLDAFLLALQQSWEQWKLENAQFQAELKQIERYLESKGCKLVNVPSDDNCLYHAICLALVYYKVKNAPSNHKDLRKELVEFMRTKEESWFLLPSNLTRQEYLERQSASSSGTPCWGDENVVRAASEKYKRTFNVIAFTIGGQNATKFARPRGILGAPPKEIELILVSFKHYMWGCPEEDVQSIVEFVTVEKP